MTHNNRQIKDFKIALKDFEAIIKSVDNKWRLWLIDGNNLKQSGKIPIEWGWEFNMRYREAWANRLLCVVLQKIDWMERTFWEDEADWYILNKNNNYYIRTEHVVAMDFPKGKKLPQGEQRVLSAIEHKVKKGEDYAKGKHLVVFMDGSGVRYPSKVSKDIYWKHHFKGIYCVSLKSISNNEYQYYVTNFGDNNSITHLVDINFDFTDWKVTKIQ